MTIKVDEQGCTAFLLYTLIELIAQGIELLRSIVLFREQLAKVTDERIALVP